MGPAAPRPGTAPRHARLTHNRTTIVPLPVCSGGGWGPLRRAPVQNLDMRGRPGLLRTTLEAQETRGLTRSDDLSRLLPSEVGAS